MKSNELIVGKKYWSHHFGYEPMIYCGKVKSDYMHGPSDFIFKDNKGKIFHCTFDVIRNLRKEE